MDQNSTEKFQYIAVDNSGPTLVIVVLVWISVFVMLYAIWRPKLEIKK